MPGEDQRLCKVPSKEDIHRILHSCHNDVCGDRHFAYKLTCRKIFQARFVWPSLQTAAHFWCNACQRTRPRQLIYGPQQPITSFGPFEKWGIDAIGPFPRTAGGKEYIIVGVDYMTRWAEAVPTSRITAKDVAKFVFNSIYCRFGTPLEIISDRGLRLGGT